MERNPTLTRTHPAPLHSRHHRPSTNLFRSDTSRRQPQHRNPFHEPTRNRQTTNPRRNPFYVPFTATSQIRDSNPNHIANTRNPTANKIYFENFPNGYDALALKKVFGRFGVSGWVFVAQKRNARNLNFGFITIDVTVPFYEALNRMNSVEIGAVRLRAYKARYSRPLNVQKIQGPIRKSSRRVNRVFHESPRDGRSYVDVAAPHRNSIEEASKGQPKIVTSPMDKNESQKSEECMVQSTSWKDKACLIRLHNISHIRNIYDLLCERGFNVEFAAPVGGECVIVSFITGDAMSNFVSHEWKVLSHLMFSVERLAGNFIPSECVMYLDLMGIPPTIICESLVRSLAGRFGRLVAMECNLERPDRLDVISCLVSVPIGTMSRNLKLAMGEREITIYTSMRQAVSCPRCQEDYSSSEDESDEGSMADRISEEVAISEEDCDTRMLRDNGILENSTLREPDGNESANSAARGNSETGRMSGSSGPDVANRNRVIMNAQLTEPRENEARMVVKVGEMLGLFQEQHVGQIVQVLEEPRV